MKTLTVEQAAPSLGRLVDLALAGEQIQILRGGGVVELRVARAPQTASKAVALTPIEALGLLQEESRLTPEQAVAYLRGVREERLATEGRFPA